MSFLLPVNFASIYLLIQCSSVEIKMPVCTLVPAAIFFPENEDTHPTISENRFDWYLSSNMLFKEND